MCHVDIELVSTEDMGKSFKKLKREHTDSCRVNEAQMFSYLVTFDGAAFVGLGGVALMEKNVLLQAGFEVS